MSEDNQPNLTSGAAKAKRPTGKELDERSAALDTRAAESVDREAALDLREKELEETRRVLTDAALLTSDAAAASLGIEAHPEPIQSTSDLVTATKGENPKAVATAMGRPKKLNADRYIAKYPEQQLFWINDMDGDVQRWIDVGAAPVPVEVQKRNFYEGISDKSESKWVRAVGGGDGMGGYYWVYLMMMARDQYYQVNTAPLVARQDAIRAAMRGGVDQSGLSQTAGGMETYAPFLPTGDRGLQKIKDHMTGR